MRTLFLIIFLLGYTTLWAQIHSEKFIFELRFAGIKGGEATYSVTPTMVDNKEMLLASLHGYTTGVTDDLFGVNDKFESYIDPQELLPRKSTKELKEQKYQWEEEVDFYQKEEMAFSHNSGWNDIKNGTCDVSALFYHLRHSGKLENLRKGQIIEIPFWDTDEWYLLELKYTGIETIDSDIGHVECLRLEPQHISGRFFNKKNPMNVWISNDDRKLPVLLEMNFSVGSVKCVLKPPTP